MPPPRVSAGLGRRTRARRARRRLRRAARAALRGGVRVRRVWDAFVAWFNALELSENAILLTFAVLIGLVGAGGVILFYRAIDLAFTIAYRWTGDALGPGVRAVYRPLITALGMAAAWALVRSLRGREGGENVAALQLAVARQGGRIPARPALVRTAASAVTLGAGGSAGSEGPVAVLGATVGSLLGRVMRFDRERVKVLLAAGAASGISASFNAPLAGAFFALEEVLGSLGAAAFPPVVVASVIAAVVSRSVLGDHPAFAIPVEYGFTLRREIVLFYPLLGVLAGLVAVAFVRCFFGVGEWARRLRVPALALPLAGGIVVGLMVWASGGVLVGYGHLGIRLEIFGRMAWTTLALLAAGKILATSLTLGAGGSGGVFTPSLFIGAATGGAFGVALDGLFPGLNLAPEAYALVGMGAVVAAATHAPITAILIVFEMTNDYAIMLPLMLCTVIATVVARHVEPDSLYSGWLRRRGEHLEHGTDRDVLAGLLVEDVFDRDPPVIGESALLRQIVARLGRTSRAEFPVVDGELRLLGMASVAELAGAAHEMGHLGTGIVAADLAEPTETLAPQDTLLEAVRRMGVRGVSTLPVVDPASGRLLGTLDRGEVLAAYARSVGGAEPGGGR